MNGKKISRQSSWNSPERSASTLCKLLLHEEEDERKGWGWMQRGVTTLAVQPSEMMLCPSRIRTHIAQAWWLAACVWLDVGLCLFHSWYLTSNSYTVHRAGSPWHSLAFSAQPLKSGWREKRDIMDCMLRLKVVLYPWRPKTISLRRCVLAFEFYLIIMESSLRY